MEIFIFISYYFSSFALQGSMRLHRSSVHLQKPDPSIASHPWSMEEMMWGEWLLHPGQADHTCSFVWGRTWLAPSGATKWTPTSCWPAMFLAKLSETDSRGQKRAARWGIVKHDIFSLLFVLPVFSPPFHFNCKTWSQVSREVKLDPYCRNEEKKQFSCHLSVHLPHLQLK